MRKKIVNFFVILIFLLSDKVVCGQIDTSQIFQKKTLSGYFLCFRDSIKQTDLDVSAARQEFLIFYFEKFNDTLLNSLKFIDLSTKSGYKLISGGIEYSIANPKEHKEYINYLLKEDLFTKADTFRLFDFHLIDPNLLSNKKKFVSIFKGKVIVLGPFLPNSKLNIMKQDLYMYLPLKENEMQYVCSILF